MRYKLQRETSDGTVYSAAPRLIDPLALPLPLLAGLSRRLRVHLILADDTAASPLVTGACDGTVTIHLALASGGTELVSVPVSVRVVPWTLPLPEDFVIGWLGMSPTYPTAVFPEVSSRPSLFRLKARCFDCEGWRLCC